MKWRARKNQDATTADMLLMSAIEMYRGDMRRRQFTEHTQDRYTRGLERFGEHVGYGTPVADIDTATCRGFLDTFTTHAASTVALEFTILSSFFNFLVLDDVIDVSPMSKVRRPKVPALSDRERTRVTTDEVRLMLRRCETWPEKMCLYFAVYTGARRNALSNLRWRDVDLAKGTVTFQEKGRKRIEKPIAKQLRAVIDEYLAQPSVHAGPNDFVIPNRKYTGRGTRSNKIIWLLVKTVADRCGVDSHVHSLRAAFAVHFLESNPGQIEDLRALMGHNSIGTTQGYLDEYNKGKAMETVRDLSFEGDDDGEAA